MKKRLKRSISAGALFRHLIVGWFCGVLLEYLCLSQDLRGLGQLQGIAAMSFPRLVLITVVVGAVLCALCLLFPIKRVERWLGVGLFTALGIVTLVSNFSWALAVFILLVLIILTVYAIFGWKAEDFEPVPAKKSHRVFPLITGILAIVVFAVICVWTICRVLTFSSPTYDFGIFSQMFYYMKNTGLPLTTVERTGLLSHFDVHISPIYYLMLPIYWLFPYPVTLQVLQAAVIVSAVIPMWLIGKQRGLSGLQRTLLCALLLLLPTTAGGAYYDLHENCFLLPLVLWLLYALDRKSVLLTALFGILTLSVKEDAAVYVAIIAIYAAVRAILNHSKSRRREFILSFALLIFSLGWFFAATGYLANQGDGVMTSRYRNFDYDGSGSLTAVIKAVLLCPMKLMYECTKEPDRLIYISQTLLPLLGLPLLTRKYERYFLLIPYILVNLMADWQYQYNIYYQYNFGSSALLLYLCAVNLADIRWKIPRLAASVCAVALSCGFFFSLIVPRATETKQLYQDSKAYYTGVHQTLEQVPDDVSVTAHTFYTVPLSQRKVLYDIRYCQLDQLLSSDYVVLKKTSTRDYQNTNLRVDGFAELEALLLQNGYFLHISKGSLMIYQKTS